MSKNDAEKIYFAIFKKKVPPWITHHFLLASKKIESKFSIQEVNAYYKLINKFSDLEAIEFTSRLKKKNSLLTEKFKIMISLAETDPENYYFYHKKKDNVVSGYLSLIFTPFISAYKLLKGFILLSFFPVK